MEARIVHIKREDLIYSHQSGVYWIHPVTKKKFRTCGEEGSRDIVDQLVRVAYFTYGYEVVYMDMFYPNDYNTTMKFWTPVEAPSTYSNSSPLPF